MSLTTISAAVIFSQIKLLSYLNIHIDLKIQMHARIV